jgi:hypothetical protein
LPSCGRKRIFDRQLDLFASVFVRRRVIDYDVFVRRDRKQNIDMKSVAVTVFVVGCNNGYVASNDVAIVLFQPLHFAFDRSAHGRRHRILQNSLATGFAWRPFSFSLGHRARQSYRSIRERASNGASQWRQGAI